MGIAKPAGPVNGQDERRIRAAVDRPGCLCWLADKGRQQGLLPPLTMTKEQGKHRQDPVSAAYKVGCVCLAVGCDKPSGLFKEEPKNPRPRGGEDFIFIVGLRRRKPGPGNGARGRSPLFSLFDWCNWTTGPSQRCIIPGHSSNATSESGRIPLAVP